MLIKSIMYLLMMCYARRVIGQMEKGSLTFVIDDTASMQGDIDQVKNGVNLIFDSVMNSEDSPIEDVLVVTFNDKPSDTNFLARTRNPKVFRQVLSKIKAHGGGNCPESCLSGIKLGLEKSRSGSFIYVFTDDVAEDIYLLGQVQNLAVTKKTQVVFILTRNRGCNGDKYKPEYQYYHDLAAATGGAVFTLDKSDVTQILNFVSEKIKNRKTKILSKTLPPGYGHDVSIPIDPAMKDTMLTCTGSNPKISDITAPDGSKVDPKTIVALPGVASVKISNPAPGTYKAKAGSASGSTFVADATTTISFKYGFSPVEPTSMKGLPTLPIKDTASHISVQIFSKEKFTPSELILSDNSGTLIKTIPLKILNDNIYVTEKILPPDGLFKIAVSGIHEISKTKLTRESETFIEVQKYSGTPKNMSPTIKIAKDYIKVHYGDKFKVVCSVDAYPKPNIEWRDNDGITFPSEVKPFKEPYSYVAELTIDKVTMSKTYICTATNIYGDVSQNIKVETERTQYLDILEEPKDTNIVFKNSANIYCKVDALPPAGITWHGPAISATDEFIEISDTKEILTIKQMIPDFVGDYHCAVTNGMETKDLKFKLDILETEPETSIEGPLKVNAEYNQPLFLRCRVKGYPEPKIIWANEKTGKEMRFAPVAVSSPFHYGMELQMEKVTESATYKCVATNNNGEHSSSVTVITIQKEHFDIIEQPKDTTIRYRKDAQITCKVDAYPSAIIEWEFDGNIIKNNDHYEISPDGSYLKIKDMQPSIKGYYSCRAQNIDTRKIFYFSIYISGTVLPELDKSEDDDITVKEGDSVDINCRIIKGTPPPTFTWEFQSDNDDKFKKKDSTESYINFESVSRDDSGIYRCFATNSEGNDYRDVYLTVEYPPSIEDGMKQLDSKKGDKTMLQCKAQGSPNPDVVWSVGGVNITAGLEYELFSDHSIRFPASPKNSGQFICTAANVHGVAKIEIQVDYYEEVNLKVPDETRYSTYVGEKERLHCEAEGYPVPTLTWEFISSAAKPGDKPKVLRTASSPDLFEIKFNSINEDGYYICHASNKKSEKSLAYTVIVDELAHIIPNAASSKPTRVVKGDLVRLPCQAVGKPKPSITWIKSGYYIPIGQDPYSLDTDGALLINGITEDGTFTCEATNAGVAHMAFVVELQDYPKETKILTTHSLEAGKSAKVDCPIAHKLVDLIRWYRGSELKATGELEFDTVSHRDAGVYTCRVSHRLTMKSESRSVQITVK